MDYIYIYIVLSNHGWMDTCKIRRILKVSSASTWIHGNKFNGHVNHVQFDLVMGECALTKLADYCSVVAFAWDKGCLSSLMSISRTREVRFQVSTQHKMSLKISELIRIIPFCALCSLFLECQYILCRDAMVACVLGNTPFLVNDIFFAKILNYLFLCFKSYVALRLIKFWTGVSSVVKILGAA